MSVLTGCAAELRDLPEPVHMRLHLRWRRDARLAGGSGMTFTPVMVDDAAKDPRPEAGRIEIELGAARVRIERGADAGMAVAVIGALRGGR